MLAGPHSRSLSLGGAASSCWKLETGSWKLETGSFSVQSGNIRRNCAVSAFDVTTVPFNPRLRLRVLLVRMWRLNALLRINFPEAVFLNRLAAPRCVFNLGIWSVSSFQLPVSSFEVSNWRLGTGHWELQYRYGSVSRTSASLRVAGFLPTRCDRIVCI